MKKKSTTQQALRIGSFNVGVEQSSLTGKKKKTVMDKTADVIMDCVQAHNLHMFSLCELGGHKQGLEQTEMVYQDHLSECEALVCQNYMTAWNFHVDASGLEVEPNYDLKSYDLAGCHVAESQLVVMTFKVGDHAGLVLGNLHIRTPTGSKVTFCSRKRVLVEAVRILIKTPAPLESDGAVQPVAYVLVGDPNLTKDMAEEALQDEQPFEPDWDTAWQVFETPEQRGGDIVIVKGAHATVLDLPVGPGKANTGVRNDKHDAIGVELRFHKKEPKCSRRKRALEQQHQRDAPTAKKHVTPRASSNAPTSKVTVKPSSTSVRARADEDEKAKETGASFRSLESKAKETGASQPASQPASSGGASQRASSAGAAPPASSGGASQPASSAGAAPPASSGGASQPASSRASSRQTPVTPETAAASILEQKLRDYWEENYEDPDEHREELRAILFPKEKHACPEDLQPGETLFVEAVGSKKDVIRRLMGVLALREEWLTKVGLPLDFQMRDKLERPHFLTWAKDLYHAEPYQRERQAADLAERGNKWKKSRMHSRWSREQQRRLGSTQMWTLVSFSGNFEPSFLKRAQTYKPQEVTSGDAAQPAAWNPSKDSTHAAKQARALLRQGENLARKAEKGRPLKPWEQDMVRELNSGNLRRRANEATRLSGFGRIRNEEDGTMEDLGPNTGGLTRTVLDQWSHEASDDEAEEVDVNSDDADWSG